MFGESYIPPEARGEQNETSESEVKSEEVYREIEQTVPSEARSLALEEKYRVAIENVRAGKEATDPRTGEAIKVLDVSALQEQMVNYLNRGLEKISKTDLGTEIKQTQKEQETNQ